MSSRTSTAASEGSASAAASSWFWWRAVDWLPAGPEGWPQWGCLLVVWVARGDLAAGQADLLAEVGGQRGRPGIGNCRGLRDRGAFGQLGRDVADAELDGGIVRGGR